MNRLPFIPLRDIVVFPGITTIVNVGRTASFNSLRKAVEEKTKILFATQRISSEESPDLTKGIHTVGVIARIVETKMLKNNYMSVLFEAENRVIIDNIILEDGYSSAAYSIINVESPDTPDVKMEILVKKVLDYLATYVGAGQTKIPQEIISHITRLKNPSIFDLLGFHLPISIDEKQKILNTFDLEARGNLVLDILIHETEVIAIELKLDNRIKDKINASQKNYFIKEKINALKEELGEGAEDDLGELQAKIKTANLPKYANDKINSEMSKLSKMPSYSAEANVARNYIETILDLPWNNLTEDLLDIKKASEVLERDHYGLVDVKERILDYLAVKQFNPDIKGGILCLVGPPGVGKTSLGKSIAEAMGRKFVRVSLGGVRDEAEIRGHRRTYVGAMTGKIIKAIKEAGTKNPVILFDEIDKLSNDFRGDPSSAMLEVLDPEQNFHFEDHYLDMPFDLSKVFFIATANDLRPISPPLRDRMETITLTSYTEIEKLNIAKKYLIEKAKKEHGLDKYEILVDDDTTLKIINEYTREAGVRNLQREINTLFRKITREILEKKKKKLEINSENLENYLGIQKFKPEKMREQIYKLGVVNGLAWTSVGGTVLEVQSVAVDGNGKGSLTLTGTLGDVMKESATVAFTYIKSHTKDLKIKDLEFLEKKNLHLHFPEGATPKDGPSAGIAITTALLSVVSNRKIRQDVAMTGEITITGEVLPIGGVKEKVIGGHRVGIREIILPEGNKSDATEIPQEISKDMKLHFVSTYKEVEAIAFKGAKTK
ncbi:MAG: endopeptidase La [Fusobacteriaceae bacterium]